jgi:replicative DNA helicase
MPETIDVTEQKTVFEFASVADLVNQTLQFSPFFSNHAETSKGIPTGFHEIDKFISGFQAGQVSTIATKAGMGKTAFLLSLTYNIAVNSGHAAGLFSPERGARKIVQRLIESETGMSLTQLNKGDVSDSQKDHLMALISRIRDARIIIDDQPHFDITEFGQKCHAMVKEQGAEILLVDHPEHFASHIQDPLIRESEMKHLLQSLATIATELSVPVVLFTQIPANLHINGRELSLNDLPESYSLSNNIIFLGRPAYHPDHGHPKADLAEVVIARHECCNEAQKVQLRYIESIDKFVDF